VSGKYILRSRAIAARVLGDEMMIMSASDSTLFSLNCVGTAIWQGADGRTPLTEIVRNRICADFDVDPETAYRDAEEFVDSLAQHGILRVADAPIDDPAAQGSVP
jgi:Coenzyme PQQ synthesis protein D (PqqD)